MVKSRAAEAALIGTTYSWQSHMSQLFDLTRTFTAHMPVFPGDPEPTLKPYSEVGKVDCTEHILTTSLHVGTHMDAPWHMVAGGSKISEVPLDVCIGQGVMVDARGYKEIPASVLDGVDIDPGDTVLLRTGHEELWGTEAYFEDFPVLSEGLAQALVRLKIGILALDNPGPDHIPFPIHHILLPKGIYIIENICNLESLTPGVRYEVFALPMKLEADGAPVRVMVREP